MGKHMDIRRIYKNAKILSNSEAFDCFLYGEMSEEDTESFNQCVEEIEQLEKLLPENIFIDDLKDLYCGNAKTHVYGKAMCNATQGHLLLNQETKDRVLFDSMDAAEAAGYRPCRKCLYDRYIEWEKQT